MLALVAERLPKKLASTRADLFLLVPEDRVITSEEMLELYSMRADP
jgi:hypothetical protein